MDNNKRTRLRSKALPVSKSVVPTVVVPSSKEALQTRSDIVEVEVEGEHDRGLPIVRGVNKRKRDPRGGGRRPSHQKLESEEGSVLVFVDENATTSGDEVRKSPGETPLSKPDPDSTSPPEVNKNYVNIIPEIMAEDQAVMKQLDKRRESSRLRVRPSKFREGFLLGNLKPKAEHKGAADNGATSLEIVLPADTHNSSVARSSDNNPKASSSREGSESDIDSSFGGPTQTSAGNNNKFKITYKLGSSKGPERKAASVVSPSTARKEVDENELKTSLAVVKRVMQIKSAEPFNEPVDPIALEIPDYFDVISEPMDLGTIRGLLEAGKKYKTAVDVYADVLLVWSNCRSYNQDGDPIMDILRIAETVFNKHWNLAGLPILSSSSKTAKAQKFEEGDEIESSDELVGALEQGGRDKAKRRKSKETKNGTKLNSQKIVHFDTSNSRLKTKRSASVEQVMAESKAREDKVEVSTVEITNDDTNLSHEAADNERIDEEHIREKVEDGEFPNAPQEVVDSQADGQTVEVDSQADGQTVEVDSQADGDTVEVDSQADGHTVEVDSQADGHTVEFDSQADGQTVEPEVTPMKDSEEEQAEAEKPFEDEVKTPVQDRDNTVRASSSNKRRTFGTVHHKPDCSCVVCVGRRRKLARQEKEGVVERKKERKHSRSHHPDNQESPQVGRSPRVRKPPKPPQDQEAVTVSPAVAVETQVMERDRADCQTGNAPEVEATVGDLRYFPATYELPLRKVTPSFLHLTQVLFGKQENTVWRRHHSLGCRLPSPLSTSSMFAAVHSLSLSER